MAVVETDPYLGGTCVNVGKWVLTPTRSEIKLTVLCLVRRLCTQKGTHKG